MFTGIIEDIATITRVGQDSFTLTTRLDSIRTGDSVAVSGVCLTVSSMVQKEKNARLNFDFSPETADRTTIGDLRAGSVVNIERALRADGRFGGHLMTGHVEGTTVLRQRRQEGNSQVLIFSAVRELARYVVPKGSVGIDGISLTVVESTEEFFSVSLIPYTVAQTTLREKAVGQRVNVEPDLLAKYAERLLAGSAPRKPVTEETLRQNGFME